MELFVLAGRTKGHNNELFLPGTVKSRSRIVEREVRRADNLNLLFADALLPLAVDSPDLTLDTVRRCAAFRPSLIATAVCSFELACDR